MPTSNRAAAEMAVSRRHGEQAPHSASSAAIAIQAMLIGTAAPRPSKVPHRKESAPVT
jgi:hypothetical protein